MCGDYTLYHVKLEVRALERPVTTENNGPPSQTSTCFPLLRDCRSHGSNPRSAMAKEQKLKKRPKSSSTSLKGSRGAKQAVKKMSKGPKRISSSQAADFTASINSQFAQVQSSYTQVGCNDYYLTGALVFTNSSLVLSLPEKPAHSCLGDCCPRSRQRHQQAVAFSKNMCVSFDLACVRIIC